MFFKKQKERELARKAAQAELLGRFHAQLLEAESETDLQKRVETLRRLERQMSDEEGKLGKQINKEANRVMKPFFFAGSALEIGFCTYLAASTGIGFFALVPLYGIMGLGLILYSRSQTNKDRLLKESQEFSGGLSDLEKRAYQSLIKTNALLRDEEAKAYKEAAAKKAAGDKKADFTAAAEKRPQVADTPTILVPPPSPPPPPS